MYVSYGAGKKPFNKGSFSFLIAFARQLEQALEERPDELEDTLGALANGLAYLTGEDSGLLPGDGGDDAGLDDDVGEASGLQDEVATHGAGSYAGGRQRGNAAGLVRTVPRPMTPPPILRQDAVAQRGGAKPAKKGVKSNASRRKAKK